MGWQPEQTAQTIKTQIQEALIDEKGWDILFFAGHSNETSLTGGEIAIAPNVSITINQITPQLKIALNKGLKFALFNSFSGLSIAKSLIDLGLNQVAIMREPIHNQVAQVFLLKFLESLAEHKDVHEALMSACEDLKQKQNLTYPCAYLVPSLFAHPSAPLFRIEPLGWKQNLKKWLPTRTEAVVLSGIAIVSLFYPLTNFLLEGRILSQSIYRDLTGQIPPITKPPVLLVQIDEDSIKKAQISNPHPMSRTYLASIIDRLADLDAKVVGIDYLFDRPSPDQDLFLAQSVRSAVEQKQIWFIFAAILDSTDKEIGVEPTTGISQPNWSLQGYTNALPQYVKLPTLTECSQICPFAYLLTRVWDSHQEPAISDLPQPKLNSQDDLRTQLFSFFENNQPENLIPSPHRYFQTLTQISQNFGQNWLRPIIDFSLPSDVVYDHIRAWQLLADSEAVKNYQFSEQIVIIAPGGYDEAGITRGKDNFPTPLSVAYWQERLALENSSSGKFTGSQAHSYMIHHLLAKRLVIPIPDLWTIVFAAVLGKGATFALEKFDRQRKLVRLSLTGTTAVYGFVGLQLYITSEILLPWLFPAITFLIYIWFFSRNKHYE